MTILTSLYNPKPNFSHYSEPQVLAITKINRIINGINSYYKISEGQQIITSRVQYILRFSFNIIERRSSTFSNTSNERYKE